MIARLPHKIDPRWYHNAVIELLQCDHPLSGPNLLVPFLNEFGIILWVGQSVAFHRWDPCGDYLELCLEIPKASTEDENFLLGIILFLQLVAPIDILLRDGSQGSVVVKILPLT